MRTVESMIKELKKFPKDALCYAYEGEDKGLGIVYNGDYMGFIRALDTENLSIKNDDSVCAEIYRSSKKVK